MLDFTSFQPGQPINARDIRFLKNFVEENYTRPFDGGVKDVKDIPCVLSVDVLQYQFLQISHSTFLDDVMPWIEATGTGGHNWLMFESDYTAGQTGVCRVIPYDMPVMLRTGGSPQNGHRYNLPSVAEDENGEFTCVGKTMDAAVFWFVRNAGVGGGSTPAPTTDYVTLITPVCNGFNDTIVGTDSIDTTSGFNALRAGLGKLQSGGTGSPLQVFMIDSDSGTLVPKTSGSAPLYYKALTVKTHSGAATPEYDALGTIEYNELSGYQDFAGHAVLYAFLQSLRSGETAITDVQYDYSGVWETTTDASEAIPNNYVLVSPHHVTGYYPHRSTFKVGGSESADISVEGLEATTTAYALDYELNTTARMEGQWNGTIKYAEVAAGNLTWTTINDVGDYINNYTNVKIVCPAYNGTNIDIYDVNKIENTCGIGSVNVPVPMGMYIDTNGLPQFVNCESIPFQCMIPILSVLCLYRMNDNNCSPSYQTNSYPIHMLAPFLHLQTVNYLPGSNC